MQNIWYISGLKWQVLYEKHMLKLKNSSTLVYKIWLVGGREGGQENHPEQKIWYKNWFFGIFGDFLEILLSKM